jgi:hypothetical protein
MLPEAFPAGETARQLREQVRRRELGAGDDSYGLQAGVGRVG